MTAPLFDDLEMWATQRLRSALAGRTEPYALNVYVGRAVPERRRDRMVTIRRDGGPEIDDHRETARLGVNVWAGTERDATDLARLVRALLWAAADHNPVTKVRVSATPVTIADESGQPLRYFTADLHVRAGSLI